MLQIDRERTDCLMGNDVKPVNDATYTPRPGGVLSRIIHTGRARSGAKFRVEQVERVFVMWNDLPCCILRHIVVNEVDGRNRTTGESGGGKATVVRSGC